jgi:TonB-dependent starch-binding outer membrane protein SusC
MQELRHGKVSVMGGTEPKLNLLTAAQIFRIVKLCTFILLAGCLHAFATGYGQKITLSEKDVPLTKVFKEIKKQTGYQFLYISEQLEQASRVTIAIKDASLEEVLEFCFREQPLGFEIKDKTVIVKPKLPIATSVQQDATPRALIDVRGVITDENGAPALGVNVMVKGTSKGTTTNLRGEFVISGVDENAILLVTSVGYDRQEILVKNKAIINTQLRVAVGNLDEMQVIAYGTTSKRFSTGNIASVKASDIEKQPVNNPILSLQGRIPGLFITQANGLPGGGITVRIQGQNSIGRGNDPFYIIDGVPYISQLPSTILSSPLGTSGGAVINGVQSGTGNPLSYLNPADIESIEVLKDADATAIYGSRAANGAILITTKKGKAGQSKVELNLQKGWGRVTRSLELLNTEQYLEMRKEAIKNDGLAISPTDYDINGTWDTTRYTNWQKELIGNVAQLNNIQLNVSGGNSNTQYLIGGGFRRETTVFPNDFENNKGSLHLSLKSTSSNQKFHILLSSNYIIDNNRLPTVDLTSTAITLAPNAPSLYDEDGLLNWAPITSGPSTVSTWTNPISSLLRIYKNKTYNLINNVNASYKIFTGFEICTNLGLTNLQTIESRVSPLIAAAPENRPVSLRNASYANNSVTSWIIEPQIKYQKSTRNMKFEALIGTTFQQVTSNGYSLTGTGFNSDFVLEDPKSAANVIINSSLNSIYKYNALFGRINHNWRNKYIVNITGRRDGSSRFGKTQQFHNFWSAGFAWVFSNENFLQKSLPFIDFGKIRGSYGTSGNDQIGDYQFLDLYSPISTGVPYQNSIGLGINGLPNPYLEWEETKKLQFGLDAGVLKDRIIFSANYFHNRSSNQLLSYALSIVSGFSSIVRNFPATVQNSGWEFSINTTNYKSKNFTWSSNVNLTIPKNKLIEFPNIESSSYATQLMIGEPITINKLFHFLGVNSTTGLYQVADKQGNATSSPNFSTDRNVVINTSPTFYGGFENVLKYHGFQLDFLFQFVKQVGANYVFGNYPGYYSNSTGTGNQPVSVLKRWQKPGDITTKQRYNSNFGTFFQSFAANNSDAFYSDASFIRLKNISLSWQLPSTLIKKSYLKNFRIYLQGQNLFTITNFEGLDPENKSVTSLPPLRFLVLGLQLGL